MSLSSRWSFLSRGMKEEKECKEDEKQHNSNNGEEVIFSLHEKEVTSVKEAENSGEQEVKTVVESSCNTGTESTGVEHYLKMRIAVTNDSNESNSHYKGVNTEVMPTMPVLFIEEFVPEFYNFDSKKSKPVTDWRAYVYYDSHHGVYVVNGTRRRNNEDGGAGIERRYPDIRMTFKSRSSLAFYLKKSMCSWEHNLSVTMYSMYRSVIHLSTPGATPSFHSIHKCRSKFRSELFGYDDCRMSIKELESYLKMLKEVGDDGLLFRPMNQ